jgi:hypothetical protein
MASLHNCVIMVPAPTAATDDHLRRLSHRFEAVDAVHRTALYARVLAACGHYRPASPRPEHVSIQTKRRWEHSMQGWRIQLRQLDVACFGELHESALRDIARGILLGGFNPRPVCSDIELSLEGGALGPYLNLVNPLWHLQLSRDSNGMGRPWDLVCTFLGLVEVQRILRR